MYMRIQADNAYCVYLEKRKKSLRKAFLTKHFSTRSDSHMFRCDFV